MRMTASYRGRARQRADVRHLEVGQPRDPGGARRPPGVADDGGTDVDPVEPVAEPGQPDRVQPGAAAGVENAGRGAGEKLAEPADVLLDEGKATAGTVMALVEVLGEQAAAEGRIRPVELGVWVERTRPGGEVGRGGGQSARVSAILGPL